MGTFVFALGWLVHVIPCPEWSEYLTAVFRMTPFFMLGIYFRSHQEGRPIAPAASSRSRDWHLFQKSSRGATFQCSHGHAAVLALSALLLLFWYVDQYLLPLPRMGVFYGCKSYWSYMALGISGTATLISIVTHWPDWSWLRYIGRNSIVFYFLNGFVYTITIRLLSQFKLTSQVLILVMLAMSLVMLACFAYLLRRYTPLQLGDKSAFDKFFSLCLSTSGENAS